MREKLREAIYRPRWLYDRRGEGFAVVVTVLSTLLATVSPAHACDLCAIYTATEMLSTRTGIFLGVPEQYTLFATLQQGGDTVPNPDGERLNSSITQLLFGYNFTPRIGVQLNLPIIARNFRRLEAIPPRFPPLSSTGSRLVRGDETGFGDLSLLLNVQAFSTVTETSIFRFGLFGGLKLPSGNPDRLREELAEDGHGHDHGSDDDEESGIHGHDLALGSGSVDGIIGSQLFYSWRRLFATGAVQYLIRTEGFIDYQYANDLIWYGGPGVFLLLGHDLFDEDYSLGAQFVLSGETKGKDTLQDAPIDDTAITSLYIGPAATFTWATALSVNIRADLPVIQNNTGLQIVPDYRIFGGFTWRF